MSESFSTKQKISNEPMELITPEVEVIAPIVVDRSTDDPAHLVRKARKVRPSGGLIMAAELTDAAAIAGIGAVLGALTVLLVALAVPGQHSMLTAPYLCGFAFSGAALGFSMFALSAVVPIFAPLAFLILQLASGSTFGAMVASSIFVYLGVDPSTFPLQYQLISWSLTTVFSILPVVACPLYFALTLSSRWQTSIGWSTVGLMVCDQDGERASFQKAFKRTVLRLLWPILFPGKLSRSNFIDEWVEENSNTVLMLKPDHLKAQLLKSDEKLHKSRDKVFITSATTVNRFLPQQRSEMREGLTGDALRKMLKPDWPSVILRTETYFVSLLGLLFALRTMAVQPVHFFFHGHGYVAQSPLAMAVGDFILKNPFLAQMLPVILGALYISFFLSMARSIPQIVSMTPAGFQVRNKANKRSFRTLKWSDLVAIQLQDVAAKEQDEKWLIFVMREGDPVKLRLDIIRSISSKEELLRAIEKWAPNVVKDAEVITALQPPTDHSYTDIWLEALATPPKRDKLKPLVPGALLKDRQYKVQKTIAVGGQGSVYLADDFLCSEIVVLKEFVLPVYVDLSVRRKTIERFEKEARLLESLKNDKIVKLLNFFVEDHRAYLVLEHLEGKNLRQVIAQRGSLPEAEVVSLAKQMCEILTYLHEQTPPVVHRDFTPDNLILSSSGNLKLIDFNVAQALDSNATTTGTVVGKPSYLAPEQFRGEPTAQSDIYSMGATLFYLLTGDDPLPIAQSNPTLVKEETSAQMNAIVAKCTDVNAGQRYDTITSVEKDLLNL